MSKLLSLLIFSLAFGQATAIYASGTGWFCDVIDKSNTLSNAVREQVAATVFSVYPNLANQYVNPPTTVIITIDPAISKGAVGAGSTGISISLANVQANPTDSSYLSWGLGFMLSSYYSPKPTTTTTTPKPTTLPPGTYSRNGYNLIINDKSAGQITAAQKQTFIDTFFNVYPGLADNYTNAPTLVTIVFEPTYSQGSVGAGQGGISVSVANVKSNPGDASYLSWGLGFMLSSYYTKNPPGYYKRNGYVLMINATGTGLTESNYIDHINCFFTYYPRAHDDYDAVSITKKVTFLLDPNYKGVAQAELNQQTGEAFIRWDPNWVKSHPIDPATVMHETGHLTFWTINSNNVWSSNPYPNPPGWLNEAIASYISWQYTGSIKNGGGLQAYDGKDWTAGYGYTANFLKWIQNKKVAGFVKTLWTICKKGQYNGDATWTQLTGKTLAAIWQEYTTTPESKVGSVPPS